MGSGGTCGREAAEAGVAAVRAAATAARAGSRRTVRRLTVQRRLTADRPHERGRRAVALLAVLGVQRAQDGGELGRPDGVRPLERSAGVVEPEDEAGVDVGGGPDALA